MNAYTLSLATIDSSFAPEVNLHPSPYALYHYYDCTCDYCLENHRFPCFDQTCQYCMTISWLYGQGELSENDEVISLAQFLALPDEFDSEEMIVYRCVDCNERITWQEWKTQDSRKERCKECLENLVYMCAECGEVEVENEDDICTSCSTHYCTSCGENEVNNEGDICDYCGNDYAEKDYDGFTMGQVLDEDDYALTRDAWLAPNGDLHFVPCYNRYGVAHHETADLLGLGGTDGAERKGYIHISSYYGDIWHAIPNRPTKAQIATARLYADAHGYTYPTFAAYDIISTETTEVAKMQNLNPSWLQMKRIQRDIFYRLSGD